MPESLHVLYIEDDPAVRRGSRQALELAGVAVTAFETAEQALHHVSFAAPIVVVTDVRLPRMSGIELLRRVHEIDPLMPVILVTGHGDVPMAIEAVRAGAYEFLEKPFASERLCEAVGRAIEARSLTLEVGELQRQLGARSAAASTILGQSPAIEALRRRIIDLAVTDAEVLIQGETGTGKELVARALHEQSPRHLEPYVALNCGGLPESLFEAELLGHEAGAFTSASKKRVGKLEFVGAGTVVLDEVETMPLALQIKLLRVLEERKFERLGSNEQIDLRARIVAASKADLRRMTEDRFRSDLYYRLGLAVIQVPPLRERLEDIPLLFEHFARQAAARYAKVTVPLPRATLNRMMAYAWPGNVRELRNVAHRHVLMLPDAFSDRLGPDEPESRSFEENMHAFERHLIEDSMRASGGRASTASEMLRLPKKTFYDKLRKHNLFPDQFK